MSMKMSTAVLLAVLATGSTRAEVSIQPDEGLCPSFLVMAVIEDADPIGSAVWQPFDLDFSSIVNPSGDIRGDGSPDMAFEKRHCGAVLVWSYVSEGSTDLMLMEVADPENPVTRMLTSGPEDDLDPRLFLEDDDTMHVVWWRPGTHSDVFLVTRPATTYRWSSPVPVNARTESARRPSVAVQAGVLRVAYERDAPSGGGQEVVVATLQPDDTLVRAVVGSTARTARLDPILHAEGSHLWVDWKEDGAMAYAVFGETGWSVPVSTPWTDPSWVGVESARGQIRRAVLAP